MRTLTKLREALAVLPPAFITGALVRYTTPDDPAAVEFEDTHVCFCPLGWAGFRIGMSPSELFNVKQFIEVGRRLDLDEEDVSLVWTRNDGTLRELPAKERVAALLELLESHESEAV